jgi:hypothetical protein
MVIVAVVAGILLSRLRDAHAGTRHGASPAVGTGSPSVGTSAVPLVAEPRGSVSATAPAAATGAATHQPTTSPTHKSTDGPAIEYFRVAAKPSCPSGTDQVRYEGQPVVLEWKVTGAEKATLSVDGPGLYAEYGAKDSATLNFPCGGDPGSYQTHTYTLKAIGPGGTRSKTLTVKAKVNEIAAT